MKRFFVTLLILVFALSFTYSFAEDYIITGNHVNFRSEPMNSNSNIMGEFSYGTPIEYLEDYDSNWCKIKYNGQEGFVAREYVKRPSSGIAGLVTTGLRFRKEPNTDSTIYSTIPQNTLVKVLEKSTDNWYKVEYLDRIGYAYADYITLYPFEDESLFGVFSTKFATGSSQKGRVYNIEKGSALINEYIVKPGEKFSLLKAIGPINKANGYHQAPEFKKTKNGTETVMGYGGGVCQIATTLYQSVCNARESGCNITVTELHHHSKDVSYIKAGDDATISWSGNQDFAFRNDGTYNLKIRTYVKSGRITCMIFRCDY